jgi:hypothetical protein
MTPETQLVYSFLELSHTCREEIATELGLKEKTDESLAEQQRQTLYFKRAKERSLLSKMWDAISKKLEENDERKLGPNPFQKVEEIQNDPKFLQLESIAVMAHVEYSQAIKNIQENFPATKGNHWEIRAGRIVLVANE